MKLNLTVFLADLFNVLEIHPVKCVRYPGMEKFSSGKLYKKICLDALPISIGGVALLIPSDSIFLAIFLFKGQSYTCSLLSNCTKLENRVLNSNTKIIQIEEFKLQVKTQFFVYR